MQSLQERLARLSDKQRAALSVLAQRNANTLTREWLEPLQGDVRSRADAYQPSLAQQQLWLLDQLEPGLPTYNIVSQARLSGPLNVAVLEQSLNTIVRRQESLRTIFPVCDGKPIAQIAAPHDMLLPVIDLSCEPLDRRDELARQRVHEEACQPFDLAAGPLWRTLLLRLSDDEHRLVLSMHHIISDGWSMQVLVRELEILYCAAVSQHPNQLALPLDLPIQYADFARWQHQHVQSGAWHEQLSYWRQQLADAPAALELPTDHSRPRVQSYRGTRLPFHLAEPLTDSLQLLGRESGCTLYMTLLAAFQTFLHRYTGQDDICVGTPVANRSRSDTDGLIGFLVNTVVMRAKLSGDPSFREFLGTVRRTALDAYAHQDLPFEKLVEELQPNRSCTAAQVAAANQTAVKTDQ